MDSLSNERSASGDGSQPTERVAVQDGIQVVEPPAMAADSAPEGAGIVDEAAPVQSGDDRPAIEEEATAFDSSAEDEIIRNWPVLDKPSGDVFHHVRRWPLLAVAAIFVAAGGSYAMHLGPRRGGVTRSSRSAPPQAIAAAANTSPAMAVGEQVAAQPVAGVPPPAAPVVAQEEVAAPAPAETIEQAPGTATPGTEGPGERCRKANAGGKGKPMVVQAACRPAIEAEPEAADIMAMLARAEIDLGHAAEARSWARKALQLKHDLADAYVFLGGAEQEMGRPAEAKAAYKKYLELAPTGRHAPELRAVLDNL